MSITLLSSSFSISRRDSLPIIFSLSPLSPSEAEGKKRGEGGKERKGEGKQAGMVGKDSGLPPVEDRERGVFYWFKGELREWGGKDFVCVHKEALEDMPM